MSLNNFNTLNSTESQKKLDNNFHYNEEDFSQKLEKINTEKIAGKSNDTIAYFIKKAELLDDKEVLEYLKLLETDPEEIDLGELIEDLNRGKGFRNDIKEKLKSNLINSISSDIIYKEYFSSLKGMPFMFQVLSIKDFNQKKQLLTNVLQEQETINKKYYNEEKLDELSNILYENSVNYVGKDKDLSTLVKGWDQLQTPLKLYVAHKIVNNLSNKFGINPPYVININFGKQDLTMGSKGIINLNLNNGMFDNYHDFIAVLIHEFTHCLQENYKTPSGKDGVEEAKKYYFNGITGDDRLNELAKEVHDGSLLEKEAYYVQAKIKERALKK